MPETYYIGLDLGQRADYTAITVLQRVERTAPPEIGRELAFHLRTEGRPAPYAKTEPRRSNDYHLVHLERVPLGTPYTAVAEKVKRMQDAGPLRGARTFVVADVTGVGLPVFEMLKAGGVTGLKGVSIHGGDAVTRDGAVYRVPKRDLVSTLQVLTQQGRLKAADGLPDWPVLRHEMQNFRAKINLASGHDGYEAWREGDHDDLVLSLAMACWLAEYRPPWDVRDLPQVRSPL